MIYTLYQNFNRRAVKVVGALHRHRCLGLLENEKVLVPSVDAAMRRSRCMLLSLLLLLLLLPSLLWLCAAGAVMESIAFVSALAIL